MRSDRLLWRVFDIDMRFCANCGGALKMIAAILERPTVDRIITHVGLDPPIPPSAPSARAASRRPRR